MKLFCVPDKFIKRNKKPLVRKGDKAYGIMWQYWREDGYGKVSPNGNTLTIIYCLMELNCWDDKFNPAFGFLRPNGYLLEIKVPWSFTTWLSFDNDGDIAVTRLNNRFLKMGLRPQNKPDIKSWCIHGPFEVDGRNIMVKLELKE